jgi:CRISPR-associated protein Cas2
MYDVKEKRVSKALKTCRKYLTWIQNSVFEGELSKAQYEKLKSELKKKLKLDEDSVIIYSLQNERYSDREIIGISKNTISNFF